MMGNIELLGRAVTAAICRIYNEPVAIDQIEHTDGSTTNERVYLPGGIVEELNGRDHRVVAAEWLIKQINPRLL
jgi:hypothetical protein